MIMSGLASNLAHSFITLGWIWSGPGDFPGLVLLNIFCISSFCTTIFSSGIWYSLGSIFGTLLRCSRVKTEEKTTTLEPQLSLYLLWLGFHFPFYFPNDFGLDFASLSIILSKFVLILSLVAWASFVFLQYCSYSLWLPVITYHFYAPNFLFVSFNPLPIFL